MSAERQTGRRAKVASAALLGPVVGTGPSVTAAHTHTTTPLDHPDKEEWGEEVHEDDADDEEQAGTNCGKLASGLRGPTEFLRTKRSARVFSVGLRLTSFLGPWSSILGPES